jgi:prepilin-type N-terminal cleavage/methylation domain-containing protein
MRSSTHHCRPSRGGPLRAYTLIELLIVIAILGMAGAVLIPNLVGRHTMVTQAAVRQVISDIVFAQSDALTAQEHRRLQFYADGSGYCIVRTSEADIAAVFDPDSADYVVDPLHASHDYIVNFVADGRFYGVTISDVDIDGGNNRRQRQPAARPGRQLQGQRRRRRQLHHHHRAVHRQAPRRRDLTRKRKRKASRNPGIKASRHEARADRRRQGRGG